MTDDTGAARQQEVQRLLQGLLTLSRAQLTLPPERWPAVLARKEQLLEALVAREPQRLLAETSETAAETRRLATALQAAEAEACAAWAQAVQEVRTQVTGTAQRRQACRSYQTPAPAPASLFLDGQR
jgi:hypothetical protein